MQCHTQAGNITTNDKVEVELTLTSLRETSVVMQKGCVDDSDKDRYDIILERDQ